MIAKSAVITLVALAVPTVLAQQPAWAQCGGQGYQGSTTCVSGYTCKYTNQYWSQCVPGAAATTAVPTTTKTSTVSAPTGVPTAGYGDVPLGGSCDPSEPYSNFCAYPYDCSPYNGLCVEPSRNSLKRNGEVCLGADIYNRACAIGPLERVAAGMIAVTGNVYKVLSALLIKGGAASVLQLKVE
ncbi:hypothetical protein HK097_011030 [Rhizophlyctis rosea]|uniref:CBM1 domain-containing protein n=1 Tax=Rhizophlyctis rosea TaxID=64517 RepID=A0AAD5S9J9_9FUNG|nr:hypothetical protein HK097_011030 [Rhizophlyctis rosea]